MINLVYCFHEISSLKEPVLFSNWNKGTSTANLKVRNRWKQRWGVLSGSFLNCWCSSLTGRVTSPDTSAGITALHYARAENTPITWFLFTHLLHRGLAALNHQILSKSKKKWGGLWTAEPMEPGLRGIVLWLGSLASNKVWVLLEALHTRGAFVHYCCLPCELWCFMRAELTESQNLCHIDFL